MVGIIQFGYKVKQIGLKGAARVGELIIEDLDCFYVNVTLSRGVRGCGEEMRNFGKQPRKSLHHFGQDSTEAIRISATFVALEERVYH